jgi:hypothetical protein
VLLAGRRRWGWSGSGDSDEPRKLQKIYTGIAFIWLAGREIIAPRGTTAGQKPTSGQAG